ELADLLSRAADRDGARLTDTLARLGDVCRDRLEDPLGAAGFYARALLINPLHPGAQAGAEALLDVPRARAIAANALSRAADVTGEWSRQGSLLEVRLATAADDPARVRLLREAAGLLESRAESWAAALTLYARAMPLAPEDGTLERDLQRLGAHNPGMVADALRAAALATPNPERALHLHVAEGKLREAPLGDLTGALEAYGAAFNRDPNRMDVREALVRCAARLGRWDVAARAGLSAGLPREAIERSFIPLLESIANETGAWEGLSIAAAGILSEAAPSEPGLARDLEVRLVRWCDAAGGDTAAERADAALGRAALLSRGLRDSAVGVVSRGGVGDNLAVSELMILRRLVVTLRRRPSRVLSETLLQISDLAPQDLDPLVEAAQLAIGPLASEPLALPVLGRLLDQSMRLLRTGQPAAGNESADKAAIFAVEEIVRLELSRPDRSAWARAAEMLVDATRLPLARPAVRSLRARAVDVATERLKDRRMAMGILRTMLDDDPQDVEAHARLAALYQEERRLPELYVLRQEELARTLDVERRLALRLELERISSALEERSGRIEVLRANLEEQPGHRVTIETLARLLEARSRHADLVEVLTDQATRLEERGDRATAARLWDWAAQVLETPIGDRDRAARAYERVAELGPRAETFESLGRIYREKG
ncbi:MAG TPA: hypothetical protein VGG33_25425, partial [Polyangia bacterium]